MNRPCGRIVNFWSVVRPASYTRLRVVWGRAWIWDTVVLLLIAVIGHFGNCSRSERTPTATSQIVFAVLRAVWWLHVWLHVFSNIYYKHWFTVHLRTLNPWWNSTIRSAISYVSLTAAFCATCLRYRILMRRFQSETSVFHISRNCFDGSRSFTSSSEVWLLSPTDRALLSLRKHQACTVRAKAQAMQRADNTTPPADVAKSQQTTTHLSNNSSVLAVDFKATENVSVSDEPTTAYPAASLRPYLLTYSTYRSVYWQWLWLPGRSRRTRDGLRLTSVAKHWWSWCIHIEISRASEFTTRRTSVDDCMTIRGTIIMSNNVTEWNQIWRSTP